MMDSPRLRELALAVPMSLGSRRMPAAEARRAVDDLARSMAFEETFEHTRAPLSMRDIAVPVTIVFGDRDWILPRGSRQRDRVPAHTRWLEKRGWGHVPLWIDPVGVAQVIVDGTRWRPRWTLPPECGPAAAPTEATAPTPAIPAP